MFAAINDLAFQYQMSSLEEAVKRLMAFIELCKAVEKGHMTNIEKIVIAREYDYSNPLAPNLLLQQIVQRIASREDRRYLMSLLTNRDTIPEQENAEPFCFDGKVSVICACAKENIVISLISSPLFSQPVLTRCCGDITLSLRNLSKDAHIRQYESHLGIRHYRANAVKHKTGRVNPYGKGKQASPMDLDSETAQQLLNRAIVANNRLYAKKNGKIYAFMKESPCVYHGYIDDETPEFVRKELDKLQWD